MNIRKGSGKNREGRLFTGKPSVTGMMLKVLPLMILFITVTVILAVLISRDMAEYSRMINISGRIRGGTQRLVKLELSGVPDDSLWEETGRLFGEMQAGSLRLHFHPAGSGFNGMFLEELQNRWEELRSLADEHRRGMCSGGLLLEASEHFWDLSNRFVAEVERKSLYNVVVFYILSSLMVLIILILVGIFAATKFFIRDRMEYQAEHDQLTGLYNRHYFEGVFARELAIARRTGRGFGLLMLDIDHFKKINDTFGHDRGDQVLKKTTALIRGACRASDLVSRFGGEEFLILAVEESLESTILFAEKLRRLVEEGITVGDQAVTVSAGAVFCTGVRSRDELIKEADRALYQAKEGGRNRVVGL